MNLVNNLRSLVFEEEFKINYIKDKLGITNYLDISHFDSNKIIINYKDGSVMIGGNNLVVSKLVKDELLIEGSIEKIEFRWFMKNNLIDKFQNKVKLNIKGKNIERFIKRLKTNKIDLLKIEYLKYNEINIIIYQKDYDKVLDLKTIYEIDKIDIYGIIKIKKVINVYKYILIFLALGIVLIIFLSNIVFNIEVVHTDSEIRKFLLTELEKYGLKKYHFKKSYQEIQNIKNNILNEYKDKIEWLEIEESGTSYIIRLESRIIPDNEVNNNKQNVVASKSAVLKKIVAENGEIVKNINSYVNQGDTVISGNIYLNDEVKDTIRAEGKIYGEVWYNVNVSYPYIYSEIKELDNYQEIYTLKLFNKSIELTFNKFKDKRIEEEKILFHPFLPISLVKQKQKEIETISLVLTSDEAKDKAIQEAIKKMEEQLADDEKIIDYQVLKVNIKEDEVVLDIFFTVYENITSYSKIEGEENVSWKHLKYFWRYLADVIYLFSNYNFFAVSLFN